MTGGVLVKLESSPNPRHLDKSVKAELGLSQHHEQACRSLQSVSYVRRWTTTPKNDWPCFSPRNADMWFKFGHGILINCEYVSARKGGAQRWKGK
jgi:hypothetical protein